MLEFIFDTTRAVSDLVFTGTLVRFPEIEWVFTHGGGALPLLADRMELFRTVFLGEDDPDGAVPRQLRRLWFDIAGTPLPHQVLRQRLLLDPGPRGRRPAGIHRPSRSACRRQLASAHHPQRHPATASRPVGPAAFQAKRPRPTIVEWSCIARTAHRQLTSRPDKARSAASADRLGLGLRAMPQSPLRHMRAAGRPLCRSRRRTCPVPSADGLRPPQSAMPNELGYVQIDS